MWPFKKKKSEQIKPQICEHKFKDFKWYIEGTYNKDTLSYKIVKPYVCIFCGKRKDIILKKFSTRVDSFKEATEMIDLVLEKYKDKIEDREIIENEINDMMLVDRKYLEIYAQLHFED